MKIFVDSANLVEIEEALERGFPAGITTNPSILAKEEKGDFREHIKKIIELVQRYGYDIPLSASRCSPPSPEEMIAPGRGLRRPLRPLPEPQRQGADRLGRAGRDPRAAPPRHPGQLHLLHVVQPGGDGGAGGRQLREPLLRPHPRHRLRRGVGGAGGPGDASGSGTSRARSSSAASATSPTSTRRSRPAPTSSRCRRSSSARWSATPRPTRRCTSSSPTSRSGWREPPRDSLSPAPAAGTLARAIEGHLACPAVTARSP